MRLLVSLVSLWLSYLEILETKLILKGIVHQKINILQHLLTLMLFQNKAFFFFSVENKIRYFEIKLDPIDFHGMEKHCMRRKKVIKVGNHMWASK